MVVTGLAELDYTTRLRSLDVYSVYGRLLRHDLIKVWRIVNGYSSSLLSSLFSFSPVRGTRGHSLKLYIPRCHLEVRRRFFCVRVVSWWNALPADVAEASSLLCFKRGLAVALGDELFRAL